jgi:hypothetical protein
MLSFLQSFLSFPCLHLLRLYLFSTSSFFAFSGSLMHETWRRQSLQYVTGGHSNFPIRRNIPVLVCWVLMNKYLLQTKAGLETAQNTTLNINKIKLTEISYLQQKIKNTNRSTPSLQLTYQTRVFCTYI